MYKRSQILKVSAFAVALLAAPAAFAQVTTPGGNMTSVSSSAATQATTIGGNVNAVTTAVPILTVGPDSRSAALGDAGVALSPDANASYWNPAKLGFVENDLSIAFSYSPWLRNIVDDMSLNYLSGYKRLNETSAISVSLMYFDLGEIQFIDINQNPLQNYNPKEYAVGVSYGQALSEYFSVGVTGRFIHSNLAGDVNVSGSNTESQPGNTAAVDVGVYYNRDVSQTLNLGLAANISNIGGKIAYSENEDKSFLPTNLKVGTALTYSLDEYNTLTLAVDASKLLVPSPGADTDQSVVSGIFSSFADAEGGASEELKEVNISTGVEYWYNELFAARVGYFYENPDKGGRQYFSAGLGLRYQKFGLDAAYLVPSDESNPLADTWRFTLVLNLE